MQSRERSFKPIYLLLTVLLLLLIPACSRAGVENQPGTAAPSTGATDLNSPSAIPTTPEPTALPQLPVKVTDWVLAADADGNFHVSGEVLNASGAAVEGVTLVVIVMDAQGNSLLRTESGESMGEESFAPLISRVENGSSIPFDYALPPGIEAPAQTQVAVTAYQTAQAAVVPLQMINLQWMTDSSGRAVLVGELVNTAVFPVRVENLAALARDTDGKILGSSFSTLFPGILMAQGDANQQDRAPFLIPFNILPREDLQPQLFSSAIQTEPVDGAPLAFDQNIETYVDAKGTFHLVSSVKNPTGQPLGALLIGGLYSASGAVMDASALLMPVDLQPGEELPFDLAQFLLINQQPDYQAKLDHFTLQVDPSRLPALNQARFDLEDPTMQAQSGENGLWTFTGEAENTTGQNLQQILVFAVLRHPSGTVAATSFAVLANPAGPLAPGVKMGYSIDVLADPGIDWQTLRPEVILTGISQ